MSGAAFGSDRLTLFYYFIFPPKSANQPKEVALTISNSISRRCFLLMEDWELENSGNGKEISAVLFRKEKEEYLWR